MNPYIPVLITFVAAGLLIGMFLFFCHAFGPKRTSTIKSDPFECGNPPSGPAHDRFAVRFYIVAMLFLLFDIEVVFLYPWAILFRDLGGLGIVEMGFFLTLLVGGLAYVWWRGALEWE